VATTAPTTREVDPETQVTISEDGKLSVGSRVPARTGVTVTCEITYPDPENSGSTLEASGSASFTVEGPGAVVITTAEDTVPQTGELTMTAQLKKADKTTNYASNEVIWELSGATQEGTRIDPSTGVLTVAEKEPVDTVLTVTVKALVDETVTAAKILTVADRDIIVLDNTEFYILKREGDRALLLSKNVLFQRAMDPTNGSNQWSKMELRNYLNGAWLNNMPQVREAAIETTIKTRTSLSGFTWESDICKVFLLSEADLYGTQNSQPAQADDYTAGERLTTPVNSWVASYNGKNVWWVLRSPMDKAEYVGSCQGSGSKLASSVKAPYAGIRPAFWVDTSK